MRSSNKNSSNPPCAIVLSGPIGSGKSTAAKYLSDKFGFQHLSFVEEIWIPILASRKLSVSRQSLQALGIELMENVGPLSLVRQLLERTHQGQVILIDDVRRSDVLNYLKTECTAVFSIYIHASFDDRFPRLVTRDKVQSREEQMAAEAISTETTIAELKEIADVVIDNTADLEALHRSLDNAMIVALDRFKEWTLGTDVSSSSSGPESAN